MSEEQEQALASKKTKTDQRATGWEHKRQDAARVATSGGRPISKKQMLD